MSWCPALSKPPDRVHRWLLWPLGVSSSSPLFNPFWSLFFWDLGTLVSVGGLRWSEPSREGSELHSSQGWGRQPWMVPCAQSLPQPFSGTSQLFSSLPSRRLMERAWWSKRITVEWDPRGQ